MKIINFQHFAEIDMRVGTIVKVENFPQAKKPAYKIWVDFGLEIGIKQTSAQVTANYTIEQLMGKQIVGVINLDVKKIAGFNSEFLLTGVNDEKGNVVVLSPDKHTEEGSTVF
jgi:tRNA-binding protein